MSDLQEQLNLLRKRIARIDRKYAGKPALPAEKPAIDSKSLPGKEVETPVGRHWEMEKLYARHRRHGSMDISDLNELPGNLLDRISSGRIPDAPPSTWAFLDTETSGLAGGAGTFAFLIGVGRITPDGFYVRQFFMREHAEESSLLHALAEHLKQFRILITYNGMSFDQPLLETRFRLARARPPFGEMEHLDLLFGARRLWKLRFDSCRLVELENQILGVERQGDLPGEMIPYVYFEYLRTQAADRLIPIFHHNAIDILTLACLTGIVPWAFHSPENARLSHGAELAGLARWCRQAHQDEQALALFRRAVERGLSDDLLFRTLWDIALLEKKLGNEAAALATFNELGACRNAFRLAALEELAKHYEHRQRDYARALEMTLEALEIEDSEPMRRRKLRLERRLARPESESLL